MTWREKEITSLIGVVPAVCTHGILTVPILIFICKSYSINLFNFISRNIGAYTVCQFQLTMEQRNPVHWHCLLDLLNMDWPHLKSDELGGFKPRMIYTGWSTSHNEVRLFSRLRVWRHHRKCFVFNVEMYWHIMTSLLVISGFEFEFMSLFWISSLQATFIQNKNARFCESFCKS